MGGVGGVLERGQLGPETSLWLVNRSMKRYASILPDLSVSNDIVDVNTVYLLVMSRNQGRAISSLSFTSKRSLIIKLELNLLVNK